MPTQTNPSQYMKEFAAIFSNVAEKAKAMHDEQASRSMQKLAEDLVNATQENITNMIRLNMLLFGAYQELLSLQLKYANENRHVFADAVQQFQKTVENMQAGQSFNAWAKSNEKNPE